MKLYQSGETVIINLKKLGWVVLRGVEVSDQVQNTIEGSNNTGKCKTIAAEGNRKTKYDINSPIPKVWNDISLVTFKTYITKKLIYKKIWEG